jgi:hypothetical protein
VVSLPPQTVNFEQISLEGLTIAASTQMKRILEINALRGVTKAVVEAARESLVIGEA